MITPQQSAQDHGVWRCTSEPCSPRGRPHTYLPRGVSQTGSSDPSEPLIISYELCVLARLRALTRCSDSQDRMRETHVVEEAHLKYLLIS